MPICTPASSLGRITEFKDLICLFVDLINSTIPVVIGLMVLVFLWGLARMILHAGDEQARVDGRHIMLWGVVGLFVATSIFGILQFFYSDFFGGVINIPPRLPRF